MRDSPRARSQGSIIDELVKAIKARGVLFFCGAGLSANSGLPLARSLMHEVLAVLGGSDHDFQSVVRSGLPFESFIEVLSLGGSIERLTFLFLKGTPNANHALLAKLIRQGLLQSVCTTNFDCLIEAALAKEGLHESSDFAILRRQTDFTDFDWACGKPWIAKLHGSGDDPDGMAIALKTVAKRRLSDPQRRVIEYVFAEGQHEYVLILGYSCSDAFDISPQIRALTARHKRIILVEHVPHSADLELLAEHIGSGFGGDTFRAFPSATRLRMDTNVLIRAIWRACIEDALPEHTMAVAAEDWREAVSDWHESVRVEERRIRDTSLLGSLSMTISQFKQAAAYFEESLHLSREAGLPDGSYPNFGQLGVAYRRLGRHREAVKIHKLTLDVSRRANDRERMLGDLGNLGNSLFHSDQYAAAIACHREALEIAREVGSLVEQATALGNLANAHHMLRQPDAAIEALRDASALSSTAGDIAGEARHIGNLGVFLRNQGEIQEAIECLKDGVSLSRSLGDLDFLASDLANLGVAYHLFGNLDAAKECYTQSFEIALLLDDPRRRAVAQGYMAFANFDEHEFLRAHSELTQAMETARTSFGPSHDFTIKLQRKIVEARKKLVGG